MQKLKKLLKTLCLAAVASLSLVGCDDYPAPHPRLVDWKNQRFLNHVLVDRDTLAFRKNGWDHDMSKLNANYCFENEEALNQLSWARRAIKKSKQISDQLFQQFDLQ